MKYKPGLLLRFKQDYKLDLILNSGKILESWRTGPYTIRNIYDLSNFKHVSDIFSL